MSWWAAVTTVLLLSFAAGAQSFPLVPIETGVPVELTVPVRRGDAFRPERVTATLFEASAAQPAPAAVIINSSGGVIAHTELFWGRLLAAQGITALVVDSFTARGVARTTDDQRRMSQTQSDADAVAGFRYLAAQPRVDAARILVMGMSKGGQTALNTAWPGHMTWLGASDVMFAAHIALTPGGCGIQRRDARTTNRPILFLLADLDDLTPTTQCLDFAERLRRAGNPYVERAVYPGVYHAMEWMGGVSFNAPEENFGACTGFNEGDGSHSLGVPPQKVADAQVRGWLERNCITKGAHEGGDPASKRHLVEDLLRFLQAHDFIRDSAIEQALGPCERFSDAFLHLLCDRGHAGYVGDVVALGRALRDGRGAPRDDAAAARLFKLTAERGNPHGQYELGRMFKEGRGVERDPQQAVRLWELAAAQDYAGAVTDLGFAYRDGVGVAKNEAVAATLFRRAALNRSPWAMTAFGLFALAGRGGVARDPAEGVRLIREAALLGNPYGQAKLAELHEKGEAVAHDPAEARRLYGLAADQAWDGQASARAAVARLAGAPGAGPEQRP